MCHQAACAGRMLLAAFGKKARKGQALSAFDEAFWGSDRERLLIDEAIWGTREQQQALRDAMRSFDGLLDVFDASDAPDAEVVSLESMRQDRRRRQQR